MNMGNRDKMKLNTIDCKEQGYEFWSFRFF